MYHYDDAFRTLILADKSLSSPGFSVKIEEASSSIWVTP